nr:MFS transporter [Cytobacillus spongiae]
MRVLFYIHFLISNSEISILKFAMLVVVFFFEVPTGYVSDRYGHKKAVLLAKISGILSILIFIFMGNFIGFLIANALLGLASSMESGARNAYYMEITRKQNIEYKDVMVKLGKYSKYIQFFLMIFSSILYTHSYLLPFIITFSLYLLSILFFSLLPNQHKYIENDKKENIWGVSKRLLVKILLDKRLRLELIFFTFTSSILISNFDYYTHFFINANINEGYFGLIFAGFMLINVIGINLYSKELSVRNENLLFILTPFSFLLISSGNIVLLIVGVLIQQVLFAYYSIHYDIYVIKSIDDLKNSAHYQSMISLLYTILRMGIILIVSLGFKVLNLTSMFIIFFVIFFFTTLYYIKNRIDIGVGRDTI